MKRFRIQRLHNEIDGVEYISKFVRGIKKVGTTYKACCPFHNEKTPSFTIYPKGFITKNGVQEYDSFYCFGCEAGGDIIKFQQLLHNISREQAVIELEKEYGYLEDEEEELDYLKNELHRINIKNMKMLSFSEVNLNISIFCRKYLEYIYQFKKNYYEYESKLIDHYFRYIDWILPDCNEKEANILYYKIENKLNKRRDKL